ncbi:MAG: SPASM domain-containing protein [Planctomycetota bacterium]|jgi:hypothetical protein
MKVIAAILADLERTTLDTPSRLDKPLKGTPVLRRTVDRLRMANRLDSVHVICPTHQYESCAGILRDSGAVVHTADTDPAPWRALVYAARKWSLDGWRGGVGGTTTYDEFVDARQLAPLMARVEAEAVLVVPPGAALIDPDLADRMVKNIEESNEVARLVFAQSPPGLTGIMLDRGIVNELATKYSPVGWVFSFKPLSPAKDLITQPPCMEVPASVRYAQGRLMADTTRSIDLMDAVLDALPNPTAEQVGDFLLKRESSFVETVPREVEIELTTDDPYPENQLAPRAGHAGSRGPIPIDVIERIADEVAVFDDSLVTLGGFGDPLLHPQFDDVLATLRADRRVYGVAVRTTAVSLDDDAINAMIDRKVDIMQVTLNAWSPETYVTVHTPGDPAGADLDEVCRRLDRLEAIRGERQSVQPIIVPDMVKSMLNIDELDAFHDEWLKKCGAVSISGPSHFADQWRDHRVSSVAPTRRFPCRRINERCIVLANGSVTRCDQDFRGIHAFGSIERDGLKACWQGQAFQALRSRHTMSQFDDIELCARCTEWHRP